MVRIIPKSDSAEPYRAPDLVWDGVAGDLFVNALDHPTAPGDLRAEQGLATQVLIQAMREAGLKLDVQAMDWGSVVQRRAKKEPPAQGGWNIFVTTSSGTSGSDPVIHTWMGAACDKGIHDRPRRGERRVAGRHVRNERGAALGLQPREHEVDTIHRDKP